MVQQATALQQSHPRFIDALDEPSACIGEFAQRDSDQSSVYTFSVERQGHPFHRHASARMFTAVSGSDGTQLRFSNVSLKHSLVDLEAVLGEFLLHAHCIQIPADCLFTVRFAAGVWHQFVPGNVGSNCPALFAVSYHPNDLSGIEDPEVQQRIKNGLASIPLLTEVLPASLAHELGTLDFAAHCKQFTQLDFATEFPVPIGDTTASNAPAKIKSLFSRTRQVDVPMHSLIWEQLRDQRSDQMSAPNNYHLDHFELFLSHKELGVTRPRSATSYMAELLTAFVDASPASVTCLMQLRNMIVRPLGLRTSQVGCPVSSLLSDKAPEYFLNRFPVLGQKVNVDHTEVQIVLGADDKHLRFRSVVMVEIQENGVMFSLSNRVAYQNWFGRFYMRCIQVVHQKYIVPQMLSSAVGKLCAYGTPAQESRCWCKRLLLGAY